MWALFVEMLLLAMLTARFWLPLLIIAFIRKKRRLKRVRPSLHAS